jgi:DNA-binding NarL/FixJ family response regulator
MPGASGESLIYTGLDDEIWGDLKMQVILADDQAKVRSALRLLLEHQPGVEILGEAVDTTGLLDWAKAACPDLVLLDWELPGLPAATLLPLLHDHCPDLRVIALSSRPEVRQAALDAGADDFVSKGDPPERLLIAIDEVDGKKELKGEL